MILMRNIMRTIRMANLQFQYDDLSNTATAWVVSQVGFSQAAA
jgi:hypothetical protein